MELINFRHYYQNNANCCIYNLSSLTSMEKLCRLFANVKAINFSNLRKKLAILCKLLHPSETIGCPVLNTEQKRWIWRSACSSGAAVASPAQKCHLLGCWSQIYHRVSSPRCPQAAGALLIPASEVCRNTVPRTFCEGKCLTESKGLFRVAVTDQKHSFDLDLLTACVSVFVTFHMIIRH